MKRQLKLLYDPAMEGVNMRHSLSSSSLAANCFRQILIGRKTLEVGSLVELHVAVAFQLLCTHFTSIHFTSRHATLTALLNNRFRRLCDFYQLTGGTMSTTCTQLRQQYSQYAATIKGVRAKMCAVDGDADATHWSNWCHLWCPLKMTMMMMMMRLLNAKSSHDIERHMPATTMRNFSLPGLLTGAMTTADRWRRCTSTLKCTSVITVNGY